eukprot:g537.t1
MVLVVVAAIVVAAIAVAAVIVVVAAMLVVVDEGVDVPSGIPAGVPAFALDRDEKEIARVEKAIRAGVTLEQWWEDGPAKEATPIPPGVLVFCLVEAKNQHARGGSQPAGDEGRRIKNKERARRLEAARLRLEELQKAHEEARSRLEEQAQRVASAMRQKQAAARKAKPHHSAASV